VAASGVVLLALYVRRWAVCLTGDCCEGWQWFCPGRLAVAVACLLAFPEPGTGTIIGRRQGSLHHSVMLQPVGACLRCFALMAEAGREQE
jgi:hypothetical protein